RLTEQREAVLQVMLKNKGKHLSAEEVLEKARKKVPNIGIATVYRTLEKLTELEVLYKSVFDGGKYRYEIYDISSNHHHHHIICLNCGKIFEVQEDLLNDLEQQIEMQGFKIVDHELKFYGYCPQCK
ncbi:MAG: transcriptional repressor, partial [Syntrophomonadaceae bacterium]|nr:transcriptional repressor [Syntrophomonadaceae bacterium]